MISSETDRMMGSYGGTGSYDTYASTGAAAGAAPATTDVISERELYDLEHRASFLAIFRVISPRLFPGHEEDDRCLQEEDEREQPSEGIMGRRRRQRRILVPVAPGKLYRSYRRRLFLFLTEPSSSYASALFFLVLVVGICASNLIVVLQTMKGFQYRPETCKFCAAETPGGFYDTMEEYGVPEEVDCLCPMEADPVLETVLMRILEFFAVEWTLRVLAYVPARPKPTMVGRWRDWWNFLCSPTTLLDAVAIWPYFIQRGTAFASLRQLWLSRVFQLVRLGTYNSMFISLTSVLQKSLSFLKLLVVVLFFGATIFGSLVYSMERGEWRYWPDTGGFHYIRVGIDGATEEISPFDSIPKSFWWFVVTATTVGYGDMVPTSTEGQWVGAAAMLTGVLVVAFPVSIFSDLWQKELRDMDIHELGSVLGSSSSSSHSSSDDDRRYASARSGTVVNGDPTAAAIAMEREDVRELLSSIRVIQQHQRGIERILEKYNLSENNNFDDDF